ncbi:AAA domain-containing protein [Prauserella shujinwangii]|uniref:AAA domain-containing protein n=1 Tax=Prauserella shujinwangii TaxID=1453103 RepID=A0A2T0M0U1_9PSEU|nr:AAA family ATPase [Prauserella shujinwangii]PRX50201.1 AAA domain-containing protein [Prauserella shujinwangii]
MSDVVVFRGLPGSGKTVRARALQRAEGGWLVGRDHLRDLLFGLAEYRFSTWRELRVGEVQEQLIRTGLRAGSNVLVDDLNLRNSYVRRPAELAAEEGAGLRVIDLTDVDPAVCRENDRARDRTVGAALIDDLYERYVRGRPYPLPLPPSAAGVVSSAW